MGGSSGVTVIGTFFSFCTSLNFPIAAKVAATEVIRSNLDHFVCCSLANHALAQRATMFRRRDQLAQRRFEGLQRWLGAPQLRERTTSEK